MQFVDREFIERILKFGSVGAFTFIIDFGLTYFLKEKLNQNKFIANSTGFIVSATVNFIINRYWTFNSLEHDMLVQFTKFLTIASFGLLLNTVIIYILNTKIRLNFYVSKLIAVFIVMFYNYSMQALFTFSQ
jgi:putative flippase GtrA